jgi:hypothetical protein
MLGFKKEPPREQMLFRDADELMRNGYLTVPLIFGDSQPPVSPGYIYVDETRHGNLADCGIAIYTGARLALPRIHEDSAVIRASWLVSVNVVTSDKKIGKAVDALIAARFPKLPAVRRTAGTYDSLFVFSLGAKIPFPPPVRPTRWFQLPRDKGSDRLHFVRVQSEQGIFTYSGLSTVGTPHGHNPDGAPFYWERDLTQVRSVDLPRLDYAASSNLWADIETVFEANGAEWVG